MTSDRVERLAQCRAQRAVHNGDLGFFLTFIACALERAADPGEPLTVEQLRDLCRMSAREIHEIVRIGSKGEG
jgi:hypothetical protein